jgi:polysaccharide export outer membrane protein
MSLNSRHNLTAAAVLMVSWGTLLFGSGCASSAVLVRNMPPEWRAQPVSNAQTVALSKLASATIPQDLIAEGDIVTVEITVGLRKEDNASVVLRVKDGAVDPPNIGPVQVVGLTTQEAEGVIRTAAIQQDVYKNPSVTVDLTRPKLNRITVTGAVNTPKTVELRPGNSDLLQAITAAGGLAKEAGTIVEIQHPGYQPGSTAGGRMPAIAENTADGVISASGESVAATPTAAKSIKVDLASLGEQKVSIPTLADGTVIWVEKQDPLPVKVDGLVRHPGHYPIPVGENLTVLDAISLAQGMSSQVADKIFVIRRRPGVAEPQLFQVSYSRAKRVGSENILLQPGDIVAVEQTPATVVLDVLKMATFGIQGRLF